MSYTSRCGESCETLSCWGLLLLCEILDHEEEEKKEGGGGGFGNSNKTRKRTGKEKTQQNTTKQNTTEREKREANVQPYCKNLIYMNLISSKTVLILLVSATSPYSFP